jgi:hypothetical protein
MLKAGLGADAIAERLEGVAADAWQYRRMVRALLDGNLPTAPTIALAAARRSALSLRPRLSRRDRYGAQGPSWHCGHLGTYADERELDAGRTSPLSLTMAIAVTVSPHARISG